MDMKIALTILTLSITSNLLLFMGERESDLVAQSSPVEAPLQVAAATKK